MTVAESKAAGTGGALATFTSGAETQHALGPHHLPVTLHLVLLSLKGTIPTLCSHHSGLGAQQQDLRGPQKSTGCFSAYVTCEEISGADMELTDSKYISQNNKPCAGYAS